MSIAGIFAYLARACAFAAAVSGLWWLMRRILKRKTRALDLLAVAYVAAVTEIIALRIATPSVARGVQWIPLKTTIGAAAADMCASFECSRGGMEISWTRC